MTSMKRLSWRHICAMLVVFALSLAGAGALALSAQAAEDTVATEGTYQQGAYPYSANSYYIEMAAKVTEPGTIDRITHNIRNTGDTTKIKSYNIVLSRPGEDNRVLQQYYPSGDNAVSEFLTPYNWAPGNSYTFDRSFPPTEVLPGDVVWINYQFSSEASIETAGDITLYQSANGVNLTDTSFSNDGRNWLYTGTVNADGQLTSITITSDALSTGDDIGKTAKTYIGVNGKSIEDYALLIGSLDVTKSGNTITLTPSSPITVKAGDQIQAGIHWQYNSDVPDEDTDWEDFTLTPTFSADGAGGGSGWDTSSAPGTVYITLSEGCGFSGALDGTFELKNTGTGASRTINLTGGKAAVQNLTEGTYTLTQVSAQDGYDKSDKTYYVTVDGVGNVCVSETPDGCASKDDGSVVLPSGPRELKVTNPAGQGKLTVSNVDIDIYPGKDNARLPVEPYFSSFSDNYVSPNSGAYANMSFDITVSEPVIPGDYFYITLSDAFALGDLTSLSDVGYQLLDSTGRHIADLYPDPENDTQRVQDISKRAKVVFMDTVYSSTAATLHVELGLNFDRYNAPQPGAYAAGATIAGQSTSWGNVYIEYPYLYYPANTTQPGIMGIYNKAPLDKSMEWIFYANANDISLDGTAPNTNNYLSGMQYIDVTTPAGTYFNRNDFEVYRVASNVAMPASLAVDDMWLQANATPVSVTPEAISGGYRFRLPDGGAYQYIIRGTGHRSGDQMSPITAVATLNGIGNNVTTIFYEQPYSGSGEVVQPEVVTVPGYASFENCPAQPPVEEETLIGLDVTKVNASDDSEKLSGAEFTLYPATESGDPNYDAGTVLTADSSETVFSIEDLHEGTYYLVETKAPAGYQLLVHPVKFDLSVGEDQTAQISLTDSGGTLITANTDSTDSSRVAIRVADVQTGALPHTGGVGVGPYALAGMVLIGLAGAVLRKNTRNA